MVLIIAHRGASGHAPENTFAAFHKALEMGADIIEVDVSISKDGVPILFHDSHVKRIVGSKGKISSFGYEEIKGFDAGSWFGRSYKGEPIPSLQDFLKKLRNVQVNFEIKPESSGHEIAIMEVIRKYGKFENCIVSSFDNAVVHNIRKEYPDSATGILSKLLWWQQMKTALRTKSISIHPHIRMVNRMLVNRAHHHGLMVFAWTANNEKDMQRLIDIGVDGIFTDYPDKLKQVLRR